MQNPISTDATRPPTDDALVDIAEYVLDFRVDSDEAKAPLEEKCRRGLETILPPNWCDDLMTLFLDSERLSEMPVDEFVSRLVV